MQDAPEIPNELRALPQWVTWKLCGDDARKVPFNAVTGTTARTNDQSTWSDYGTAVEALHTSDHAGLGFVFAGGGGLFGIDLDGCIDAEGGIQPWAMQIVRDFATYAEISPSGTGIKLFARGSLDRGRKTELDTPAVCDRKPAVEMYGSGRYFTVTGQRVGDTPLELRDCQEQLDALTAQLWPEPAPAAPKVFHEPQPAGERLSTVERARRYLHRMPPAVSGQGGHNATFRAACVLVLGFNLPPELAFDLLAEWNGRCEPPWTDRELWHKIGDASKRPGERGWLLTDNGRYEGPDVDLQSLLSSLHGTTEPVDAGPDLPPDPHGFPVECIRAPGLLADIVNHNLDTAMFQQPELAFAAAVALLATITGGKVTDRFKTRTNCYVLGLAPSGAGKDHGRKLNREILIRAGGEELIGPESFASSAGLTVAVSDQPTILFQVDEISRLLATMQDAKRSPHLFKIASVLMQLYTSSDSIWKGDAYAEAKKNKTIKFPHAVVYGTATPDGFWTSLSADNLTDGLLGRFMVFESPGYCLPRTPATGEIPESIFDRVRHWLTMTTGQGNLAREFQAASPMLVSHAQDAFERASRHQLEICTRRLKESAVEAAVWSRTGEKTNKLALIFACSRCNPGFAPSVSLDDVELAIRASNWLTRKMLRQAGLFTAVNDTEATVKKVLRLLQEPMTKHQLSRKTQWLKKRERDEILAQLTDAGQIEIEIVETAGRHTTIVKLAGLTTTSVKIAETASVNTSRGV